MIEASPPATHIFATRVYYEDTDAVGVVYYANYLKFAERARTEFLRDLGVEQSALTERHGMSFVVRRCAVDYRQPAKLDDRLEVRSKIRKLGRASLSADQTICRDGEILVEVAVDLACIGPDGRPVRMPSELYGALADFSKSGGRILTASQT